MEFEPGVIVSHAGMCLAEGKMLQQGMHFRSSPDHSVLLMSLRKNAVYDDRIEDDGRTLVYEGHDANHYRGGPDPKTIDQPEYWRGGTPTQNRRFHEAATSFKGGTGPSEIVHVYQKLKQDVWTFRGVFRLLDSWTEPSGARRVFKFRLRLTDDVTAQQQRPEIDLAHNRLIPSAVMRAVFERDRGQCCLCGATDNLHFDHILPFSKGGTSLRAENIQILCARHNLQKHDRIQ